MGWKKKFWQLNALGIEADSPQVMRTMSEKPDRKGNAQRIKKKPT